MVKILPPSPPPSVDALWGYAPYLYPRPPLVRLHCAPFLNGRLMFSLARPYKMARGVCFYCHGHGCPECEGSGFLFVLTRGG